MGQQHRTYRVAAHHDEHRRLGGGYVQRTVLYHLLDEGVSNAAIIAGLSGCTEIHIGDCLRRMAITGLAQQAPQECIPPKEGKALGRRFTYFSLTKSGIEAAKLIDVRDVEFAEPVAQAA